MAAIRRLARSTWLRAGLKLLIWEAAVIGLAWLLHQQVSGFRRLRFCDELLLIGTLLLMAASAGMWGRPYHISGGPRMGVPALPVQDSEEQRRFLMMSEYIEQRSFAFRLAAIGVLTIIIAVSLSYLSY